MHVWFNISKPWIRVKPEATISVFSPTLGMLLLTSTEKQLQLPCGFSLCKGYPNTHYLVPRLGCGLSHLQRNQQLQLLVSRFAIVVQTHYIWFGTKYNNSHIRDTGPNTLSITKTEKKKNSKIQIQITDKVGFSHKPEGSTFSRKLQFHTFWTPEEKIKRNTKLNI